MAWFHDAQYGTDRFDPAETPPRRLLAAAFTLWAALLSLHFFQVLVPGLIGGWRLDVDQESGLYTWFSTLMLSVTAVLIFDSFLRLPLSDRVLRWGWFIVGLAILAISADEMLTLHESLSESLSERYQLGGYLRFAWIIPFGIAVIVFFLAMLPFLGRLPRKTRWWVICSGAMFVTGAIGMEAVGGQLYDEGSYGSVRYGIVSGIEEALEGLGILLLLRTLLDYRRMMGWG